MNIKGITFLLLVSSSTFAQSISKQDALEDFNYLNKAIVNGHPVNYNPIHPINIGNVILELKDRQTDSLTVVEYSTLLGKALRTVGDIHTSVARNPLISKSETYSPVKLTILNEKLYIVAAANEVNVGKEVLAINGVNAGELIGTFSNCRAADGGSVQFSQEYFSRFSETYVARYFKYPAAYTVETELNTITLNASKDAISNQKSVGVSNPTFSSKENQYTAKDPIGILKMSSFYKNDLQFLERVFQDIRANKINYLVLDLRGNLGGDRKTTVNLASRLLDTTFGYSILQPKLKPFKYLTSKGKLLYTLSKLKYNIGNFYLGHKTPLGRKFNYTYKQNKAIYDGKLFVITDGFTASASTMLTSWLKKYTTATFVGSQAGGGYNGNGGGSFPLIQLPKSKIEIRFPVYRLVLDENSTKSDGIIPEIQPTKTIDDLLNQRDVDMDTIFRRINQTQK